MSGQTSVPSLLQQLESSEAMKHGSIGFSLIELDSGESKVRFNGDKALVPASSIKLLISLSALDILGSDYKYESRLSYDGEILDDGTLIGNLYFEGSGDPTLGSSRISGSKNMDELFEWINRSIKSYGITCIDGDIVADASIFDHFPISPSWQFNDLGNYYASGAWGINLNENVYRIYFSGRNRVGELARISRIDPEIPGLSFINEVRVDKEGSGDNAYIYGSTDQYVKRIRGTIPAGKGTFDIKGAIPNPPLYFAYQMHRRLERLGISSQGFKVLSKKADRSKPRKKIKSISSPSLEEIIKQTNLRSINLFSESLLQSLGVSINETFKSEVYGLASLKKYFDRLGLDQSGLYLEDGSGLSSRNLVTTDIFSNFLVAMEREHGVAKLKTLLPESGNSGTLKYTFRKSPLKAKVWAKTGSMERVLSYTGFIEGKSGKLYAFSFIANNFTVKNSVAKKRIYQFFEKMYELI